MSAKGKRDSLAETLLRYTAPPPRYDPVIADVLRRAGPGMPEHEATSGRELPDVGAGRSALPFLGETPPWFTNESVEPAPTIAIPPYNLTPEV